MKKNSNAFVLVKSLSMSEKRYFKIFSERHIIGSQNKYVALFDQLDKATIEEDAFFIQNLKKAGMNADFISADKNYLYQLILKSLNDFHKCKTYNLEIKEALISVEILFHKGLYLECLKLISKTEIIANECENFQLSIDLLMWKKKCSGYSLGLKKASEVNKMIDTYLLLLNNLKRITDLYYESNLLQSENENYSKKEVLKKYEQILKQPELKSESKAISFSAKIFYYLIYSNYYYACDNKPKEYECLQKLIDILNASKIYALENSLDYVSIYNRLLSIKKHFKSSSFFDDIFNLREFAKQVPFQKEVILERVFVHTNTHEIEYYLINNDFSAALQKIKEIEKEIQKLNLSIEPYHLINFYYLYAITLVYFGEYHKALKFINIILNDFDTADRPQVFMRVEMLNIVVHFELKNDTLVNSLATQILKKNKSCKILLLVEETIVNAILKISGFKHSTLKDETDELKILAEAVRLAKKSVTGSSVSLIEQYDKWITAKIKRKIVADLYR